MPSAVLWGLMLLPTLAALTIAWHLPAPAADSLSPEHFDRDFPHHRIARIRDPWLLALLPIIQFAASSEWLSSFPEGVRFRLGNSLTLGILALFLVRNWANMPRHIRSPVCVFVLGVIFNSIPRIVLGAMPYSSSTARLGGIQDVSLQVHQAGHVALTADTNFWLPLSDFIPLPGLNSVVSIGDLVMLVGLTLVIGRFLRWGTSQRVHPRRDGPVESCDAKGFNNNDEIRAGS